MRLAVLSDIHGNLAALEAALAGIEADACRVDLRRVAYGADRVLAALDREAHKLRLVRP